MAWQVNWEVTNFTLTLSTTTVQHAIKPYHIVFVWHLGCAELLSYLFDDWKRQWGKEEIYEI